MRLPRTLTRSTNEFSTKVCALPRSRGPGAPCRHPGGPTSTAEGTARSPRQGVQITALLPNGTSLGPRVSRGVPVTGAAVCWSVSSRRRPGPRVEWSGRGRPCPAVTRAALAQLPGHQPGRRPGREVLIRTDGAGSSHRFLQWLTAQRLSYSVGFALPNNTAALLNLMQDGVGTPDYNADGHIRERRGWPSSSGCSTSPDGPPGAGHRPQGTTAPVAQLRITDADGLRATAFAPNTTRGQLPDLELRYRRRARAEDRIRCAKDTGLRNLPQLSSGLQSLPDTTA